MACCTSNNSVVSLFVAVGAAFFLLAVAMVTTDAGEPEKEPPPTYVLGYEMARLDGEPQELEEFKGSVLLMVNTASRCGLTPQYEGLQALYEGKSEDGLVVLGFPANNFGKQEPGTNEQIAEFCEQNYGVTFPMFEKISVKGDDVHPLYAQLIDQPEPIGGEPEWNFTKFLVDRHGDVVARFGPRTKPDDEELLATIDELLAEEIEDDEG